MSHHKRRGEWAELQFMAKAAKLGLQGFQTLGRTFSLRHGDPSWQSLRKHTG